MWLISKFKLKLTNLRILRFFKNIIAVALQISSLYLSNFKTFVLQNFCALIHLLQIQGSYLILLRILTSFDLHVPQVLNFSHVLGYSNVSVSLLVFGSLLCSGIFVRIRTSSELSWQKETSGRGWTDRKGSGEDSSLY